VFAEKTRDSCFIIIITIPFFEGDRTILISKDPKVQWFIDDGA